MKGMDIKIMESNPRRGLREGVKRGLDRKKKYMYIIKLVVLVSVVCALYKQLLTDQ